MKVLFYVSGHGFGHATRVAEIIRARDASWLPAVRTAAPAALFPTSVTPVNVDSRVHESADALHIDAEATLRSWSDLLSRRGAIVASETAWVRENSIRLILSDIPFLAGLIGLAAGVPCIGVSNFTWNWILEPHFSKTVEGRRVLEGIEEGYSRMRAFWRLPFSHSDGLSMFPSIVETPLIAPAATADPALVRASLNAAVFDRVVMVAFRGQISNRAFRNAAAQSPQTLFLTFDAQQAADVPNARHVHLRGEFQFQDFAAASDIVIAKLGYGLVSGAVVGKNRLLYPPRSGFREDEITSLEARRFTVIRQIAMDDFLAGDWSPHVDAILAEPMPAETIRYDGATEIAARIRTISLDGSI